MASSLAGRAVAQTASADGAKPTAIYLDEPEVVAEPRLVNRTTRQDKYEDGSVRLEQQVAMFSDNHLEADGFYREFHPNGKPFIEGQFRRGRQEGEWTFWHENGQLNRKMTYNSGKPHGAWEVFRADGTLSGKRSFKEGLRDGEWINFDKTGEQMLLQEHYTASKLDGVRKVWFPNGKLRQEAGFKQGRRHGTAAEWNENGDKIAEVTYVEDKPDGTAMQVLPDGRKVVQEYRDGKLVPRSKP
jgi:antitoxin component YwqK of YwqJK toxin-antitoxin module